MSLLLNFIHYCDNDANYYIPESHRPSLLENFRANYYPHATFETHSFYLRFLYAYQLLYDRFPTKTEFHIHFRPICMCIYSLLTTRTSYILASEFFMRELGHLRLECNLFYYHLEFYMFHERHPNNMYELEAYISTLQTDETAFLSTIMDRFEESSFSTSIMTQEHNERVRQLPVVDVKEDGLICGICHEEIKREDKALKLEKCNHHYHSESQRCCETGTIFTWLERNDKCPMCRTVI